MHPHKNESGIRNAEIGTKKYWDQYSHEASGRLITMAKRNVLYTATIESPVRNSPLGIPDVINQAVIDDYKADVFNYTGTRSKRQDAHDGSTYMDYVYSLMVDNSYPGKGYSGTKKQFGTLITPNGVTIKKDAESVITNDKILNSKKSDISLLNKKRQMLGIPIGSLNMTINKTFDNEHFYNENGILYNIREVIITNNEYKIYLSKKVGDS